MALREKKRLILEREGGAKHLEVGMGGGRN